MIFSVHYDDNVKRKGNKGRARRSVKGVQMEMMKLWVKTGLVGTVTRGLISTDVAGGTLQDSLMSEK